MRFNVFQKHVIVKRYLVKYCRNLRLVILMLAGTIDSYSLDCLSPTVQVSVLKLYYQCKRTNLDLDSLRVLTQHIGIIKNSVVKLVKAENQRGG